MPQSKCMFSLFGDWQVSCKTHGWPLIFQSKRWHFGQEETTGQMMDMDHTLRSTGANTLFQLPLTHCHLYSSFSSKGHLVKILIWKRWLWYRFLLGTGTICACFHFVRVPSRERVSKWRTSIEAQVLPVMWSRIKGFIALVIKLCGGSI